MKEFEEIGHTGGKILISRETYGFSHSSAHACSMYQICASFNGMPLAYIPMGGLGSSAPIAIQPSIPVLIFSDKEGFFGRVCPECKEYFRTTVASEIMHCPYCGQTDYNVNFFTVNQLEYVKAYTNAFGLAITSEKEVEIDLDKLIDCLPNNKSSFVYSEERQQKRIICKRCNFQYDILGEYGYCPYCKKRNSLEVFYHRLEYLKQRVENPVYNKDERERRENEWIEVLKNCVSEFEALANDICQQLLNIPATPKRKKDLSNLSFQSVLNANDCFKKWFSIDFLQGLSDEEKDFLNRYFNRRHLFTHKAGVVDEEYLKSTNDNSVKLRQKVRVRSREVRRLLELVRTIGTQLFNGYESIE